MLQTLQQRRNWYWAATTPQGSTALALHFLPTKTYKKAWNKQTNKQKKNTKVESKIPLSPNKKAMVWPNTEIHKPFVLYLCQ